MSQIKRIGILTSGGDCPGLNAVIRAVVHRAIWTYGWEVYGILDGTDGLTFRPLRYRKLTISDFHTPYARLGGTILGTINKGSPFAYPMPDGTTKDLTGDFGEGCRELGIDALVVIGGDGSMAIVSRLCHGAGIPMVGIPKTIDNDTPITEHSVGFSTARDICVEALDRLDSTAASHHRAMILEVMGRDAGHVALQSAIAGGADVCLIPELPYTLDGVVRKLHLVREQGRDHALIVVAEGIKTPEGENVTTKNSEGASYGGVGHWLAAQLNAADPKFSTRVTVLGYVQRGGIPAAHDRLAAATFGVHAVDVLAEGKTDRMVAWVGHGIKDFSLEEVVSVGNSPVDPNGPFVKTARGLGMYVGE